LHPFPGSLQAKFHLCPRRQTPTPCLMTCVSWTSVDWGNHCLSIPWICLWSLNHMLRTGIQLSSIVMSRFRTPIGSQRNRCRIACEASKKQAEPNHLFLTPSEIISTWCTLHGFLSCRDMGVCLPQRPRNISSCSDTRSPSRAVSQVACIPETSFLLI
jgi:hypothetical protein